MKPSTRLKKAAVAGKNARVKKKPSIVTKQGSYSPSRKLKILRKTSHRCHVCGRKITQVKNAQVDHVRQSSQGGNNKVDNLLACCKPCNSNRGGLHYSEIKLMMFLGKKVLRELQKKDSKMGDELAELLGEYWVKFERKS